VDTFKKWIPVLITVGGTIISMLTPAIQHFWSTHPETTVLIAGIWAVVKGLLPSPVVDTPKA
jgi:hypothetical protein